MRWPVMLGLILLAAPTTRADGPAIEVYTTRQFDEDRSPRVGEETALGQYSHSGDHMGVFCYRDADSARLDFDHMHRDKDAPAAVNHAFRERFNAEGREFVVPYGTPVTVVDAVKIARYDGETITCFRVRFDGGPRRGKEGVIGPHRILRRRTKEEIAREGRFGPLPGYSGLLGYTPKVGDRVILGQLDVKAGKAPGPHGPIQYRPILRQGVPSFPSMAAFRDHFAVKKEPLPGETAARPRAHQAQVPPATFARVLRLAPADGEVPAAAQVEILDGPLAGQVHLIPAAQALKSGGVPPLLPVGYVLFQPDYAPETDGHPAKHARHADPNSPPDKAKVPHNPPAAAKAASLLGMARGSEQAGHLKAAADYYKKLIEAYPDSPEAAQARERLKLIELR